jgi:putative FmdB family regulatory protein
MPVYEYECRHCTFIVEAHHKMADSPRVHCPSCGEVAVRILSLSSVKSGHSSPTAARHAGLTKSDEVARESELQRGFKTLWFPEAEKAGLPD